MNSRPSGRIWAEERTGTTVWRHPVFSRKMSAGMLSVVLGGAAMIAGPSRGLAQARRETSRGTTVISGLVMDPTGAVVRGANVSLVRHSDGAVVSTSVSGLYGVYRLEAGEGVYELLVSYRSGDMWSPQLEQGEALRQELSYFVDCVSTGNEPFNNGCAGLRVVRMLETASESLNKKGALVYL